MLNRKFLTKLLNDGFRRSVIARNRKFVESEDLKLKQYAVYAVDKYSNDRDSAFVDLKEANYGYSPLEVLAYVAKDNTVKTAFFEFNSVCHFLKKKDHERAVEVAVCILSELASENRKDILCFDIDKIDAHLKKIEEDYIKSERRKAEEKTKKLEEKETIVTKNANSLADENGNPKNIVQQSV